MPRPKRPEVSTPELRAALDRVGLHIENYHQNLDLISNDIRGIEEYLTASGVRQWAAVKIGHTEEFTDGDYDGAGNYSGGITRDVERIMWGPASDDSSARWRLMYEKYRKYGEVDIVERIAFSGPTFKAAWDSLEKKPLIEMSANTRLQAHPHLAELMERVGKLVEFRPMTLPENAPPTPEAE